MASTVIKAIRTSQRSSALIQGREGWTTPCRAEDLEATLKEGRGDGGSPRACPVIQVYLASHVPPIHHSFDFPLFTNPRGCSLFPSSPSKSGNFKRFFARPMVQQCGRFSNRHNAGHSFLPAFALPFQHQ